MSENKLRLVRGSHVQVEKPEPPIGRPLEKVVTMQGAPHVGVALFGPNPDYCEEGVVRLPFSTDAAGDRTFYTDVSCELNSDAQIFGVSASPESGVYFTNGKGGFFHNGKKLFDVSGGLHQNGNKITGSTFSKKPFSIDIQSEVLDQYSPDDYEVFNFVNDKYDHQVLRDGDEWILTRGKNVLHASKSQIHYPTPTASGLAALVRGKGYNWQVVGSTEGRMVDWSKTQEKPPYVLHRGQYFVRLNTRGNPAWAPKRK